MHMQYTLLHSLQPEDMSDYFLGRRLLPHPTVGNFFPFVPKCDYFLGNTFWILRIYYTLGQICTSAQIPLATLLRCYCTDTYSTGVRTYPYVRTETQKQKQTDDYSFLHVIYYVYTRLQLHFLMFDDFFLVSSLLRVILQWPIENLTLAAAFPGLRKLAIVRNRRQSLSISTVVTHF